MSDLDEDSNLGLDGLLTHEQWGSLLNDWTDHDQKPYIDFDEHTARIP